MGACHDVCGEALRLTVSACVGRLALGDAEHIGNGDATVRAAVRGAHVWQE